MEHEHEHESEQHTHDEHYYGQDDSGAQPTNEFGSTAEETQPEPQPQQPDPRNQQQQYQSRAPGKAPPSRPAPTMPPRNYTPQSNPRNYPPQAIPQQVPPQRGYYPPGQPVQAPPAQYPPGTYSEAPTTSPYNPPGVNYQNAAPPMYTNTGYAAPPTPGYPQQSPYQPYLKTTGTVGWSTGLFDCMDDPNNALITACCPCFTFGQIAEIVDSGHTTCATSGILYGCIAAFTLLPCLISCTYRTKMRSQYDLVEIPAADWITHIFCEWCALCQEYRELKNRGIDPAIGWHGNMMRNQQQPQVAMMPPGNQTMRG